MCKNCTALRAAAREIVHIFVWLCTWANGAWTAGPLHHVAGEGGGGNGGSGSGSGTRDWRDRMQFLLHALHFAPEPRKNMADFVRLRLPGVGLLVGGWLCALHALHSFGSGGR